MMNTGILLVDVLNILPDSVECFIQAPDLESNVIEQMTSPNELNSLKLVKLNTSNRNSFIQELVNHSVGDYFQRIDIKSENKLLFQGYDGIDFGTISQFISIPESFNDNYVKTGDCMISDQW